MIHIDYRTVSSKKSRTQEDVEVEEAVVETDMEEKEVVG